MRQAILAIFFSVSGCAAFPQLDARISDAARAAPYPTLQPIGPLLDQADAAITEPSDPAVEVQARAAALSARAAALRGPVVDQATRAEMRDGVDRGALQ